MSTQRHVFFSMRTLIFLSVAMLTVVMAGCKDDAAAVEAAEEKANEIKKKKKAAEDKIRAEKIPMTPIDLFRQLPKAPPGIAVLPGATIDALKKKRPTLKDSSYSSLWKSEHPKDGPFRMIHYQMGKEDNKVQAILGTFVMGYTLKERKDALIEAIQIRLGAGEEFSEPNYSGRRWKLIDYRLDLRTDKSSKSLELLIHQRGRFDPVAQPKGE